MRVCVHGGGNMEACKGFLARSTGPVLLHTRNKAYLARSHTHTHTHTCTCTHTCTNTRAYTQEPTPANTRTYTHTLTLAGGGGKAAAAAAEADRDCAGGAVEARQALETVAGGGIKMAKF